MLFHMFKVPSKAKLIDEQQAKKLEEQFQALKQSYRPEQGWLDAKENAVKRVA